MDKKIIGQIKNTLIEKFQYPALAVSFLSFTETIGLFACESVKQHERNLFFELLLADVFKKIFSNTQITNNVVCLLWDSIENISEFTAKILSKPQIGYILKYYNALKHWQEKAENRISEILSILSTDELERTQISYRQISIPKKNGGSRELTIPNDGLRALQKTILKLMYKSCFHSIYAHGFQPNKSAYTNAIQHNKAVKLLKIDIKDAFPSTSIEKLSAILSGILGNYGADFVIKYCTYKNRLPQGAPTSGWLLNIALLEFDAYINRVCHSVGLMYTRYADDICVSVNETFKKDFSVKKMYALIKKELEFRNYHINSKKTGVRNLPRKITVTGYVLNSGKPTISRKTRRIYRAMLHNHKTGKSVLTEAKINGVIGHVKTAHPECVEKWTAKYLS